MFKEPPRLLARPCERWEHRRGCSFMVIKLKEENETTYSSYKIATESLWLRQMFREFWERCFEDLLK